MPMVRWNWIVLQFFYTNKIHAIKSLQTVDLPCGDFQSNKYYHNKQDKRNKPMIKIVHPRCNVKSNKQMPLLAKYTSI